MKAHKPLKSPKGFTLVEILIALAIIAIIIAIAVAALNTSKSDSVTTQGNASATTLNIARDRVILKGIDNINTRQDWDNRFGNDTEAALTFLEDHNMLTVR